MAIPTDIIVQMYAGDDVDINVQIKNASGTVIDYNAYEDWRAQWRRTERASEAIPATVVVGTEFITVSFSHEQTREMGGDGFIDLQAMNDSRVRTWFKAKAKYVWDVTK